MFNHLKGNQTGIIRQMQDAVNAIYGKLIKRVVRNPRSDHNQFKLPRLLGFPDLPTFKTRKISITDFSINDGTHFHATVLVPEQSRLKEDLATADSDEAGQAFQSEAGHPFRDEAGHGSELKSATWRRGPCGSR
jgi:hypothetical protein